MDLHRFLGLLCSHRLKFLNSLLLHSLVQLGMSVLDPSRLSEEHSGMICQGARSGILKESWVKRNHIPTQTSEAGRYSKVPSVATLLDCVVQCCEIGAGCHAAFWFNSSQCLLIDCQSAEGCQPRPTDEDLHKRSALVIVRRPRAVPVVAVSDVRNLISNTSASTTIADVAATAVQESQALTVTISGPNEVVLPIEFVNLTANLSGVDEEDAVNAKYSWVVDNFQIDPALQSTSSHSTDGSVEDEEGDSSGQNEAADTQGQITGQQTATMKLSQLMPGLYDIKVDVTLGKLAASQTHHLVVKSEPLPNKPPVAVINPKSQRVKELTQVALNGRDSYDPDDAEKSHLKYHWEVVASPIPAGSSNPLQLEDAAVVTLKELAPGDYTFRLTVTDLGKLTNSTETHITVEKAKDLEPVAIAGDCENEHGGTITVHLPQEVVYICGNMSTDDKRVVSYEWNVQGSVDTEGSKSSVLQLKSLTARSEPYKITLVVKDEKGQSSQAEVLLYVLEATNNPPVANAGGFKTIILPKQEVVLDGSGSSDDGQIATHRWTQIGASPSLATIINDKEVKATATKLMEGVYRFQLNVTDDKGLWAVDYVNITVNRSKNAAPIAKVANVTVRLPFMTSAVLNGSESSDDAGIVTWSWTLMEPSLAGLEMFGNSSSEPILRVGSLYPGKYLLNLSVCDSEQVCNSKIAQLTATESDDVISDTVELYLDIPFLSFTVRTLNKFKDQAILLLNSKLSQTDAEIHVSKITEDPLSGRVRLLFHVDGLSVTTGNRKVIDGLEVVHALESYQSDFFKVWQIDTKVCRNRCSTHGKCNDFTKYCECDKFWMPNFFKSVYSRRHSNCDWSILYFVILSVILVSVAAGVAWVAVCHSSSRFCRKPKRRRRYKLGADSALGKGSVQLHKIHKNREHKEQMTSLLVSESDDMSNDDSDDETLFDSRKSPINLNHHPHRSLQQNGRPPLPTGVPVGFKEAKD